MYFANAGHDEYLLASADWMPRNLDRRVEIAFPILDAELRERLQTMLRTQLADTVKGRRLLGDGRSVRREGEGSALRSQVRLWEVTHASEYRASSGR